MKNSGFRVWIAAGVLMTLCGCRTPTDTQTVLQEEKIENPLSHLTVQEAFLTNHPCYKAGKKIEVKGLMLHSVGCSQPSAEVFVRLWNREDFNRACVHGFIDAHTGVVWQTLPWDHFGWHGGSGANGSVNPTHIGVEMCESEFLEYVGGATFKCSNVEASKEMAERTYNAAADLFAMLCYEYKLDPMQDGVIISHYEGNKRGIACDHVDPEHLWRQLKMDYTMDTFRQEVQKRLEAYRKYKDKQ